MTEKLCKYFCRPCGYIYDPEKGEPTRGIEPGTPFESFTEKTWTCPKCGASIWLFEKVKE